MRRSVQIVAAALLGVAMLTVPVQAQSPDLMLSQAERDSILKNYHSVFPLLGRKAIERGFDIPKPLGFNIIGFYVDQNIDIGNLGLSTNDNPITPTDFIGFGTNTSSVSSPSTCGGGSLGAPVPECVRPRGCRACQHHRRGRRADLVYDQRGSDRHLFWYRIDRRLRHQALFPA